MFIQNKIIGIILLSGLIYGQSSKNGFGVGDVINTNNASSMGVASVGIVPAFRSNVGLNNPTTWKNLNFAYISTSYSGNESNFSESISGRSELTMVKLIVPFKSKWSIGVEFKPYSNQKLDFYDNNINNSNNSLSLKSGGGISSVNLGIGGMLTTYESFGLVLDMLYGSGRLATALGIDSKKYTQMKKYIYSGTLLNIYGHTNRFNINAKPIDIYFKSQISVLPVNANEQTNSLFEDINLNDYYDYSGFGESDYPNPSLLGPTVTEDYIVHSPFQVGVGLNYHLTPNVRLSVEGLLFKENADETGEISVLGDYPSSGTHFSLSTIRHGKQGGRQFMDNFLFRSGVYFDGNVMKFSEDKVTEKGLNLGLGIKFGIFNNQIDFGYSYGIRSEYGNIPGEIIQNASITLSLGDLWFVKRRAR